MTAEGKPYVVGGRGGDPAVGMAPGEDDDVVLYTTCINGPYYDEYIPKILREIIAHEKPDGFTDNHWAGQGRDSMCYCVNCKSKFRQASGKDLPTKKDWNDPVYRQWIEWSHKRRRETWDLFTNTTKAAGLAIWSGMLSGNFVQAASSFRDMKNSASVRTLSCWTTRGGPAVDLGRQAQVSMGDYRGEWRYRQAGSRAGRLG